jgi:protein-tyrosine phosphatase
VSRPHLRVATICTGNICRSPMAEVVLKHLVAEDPDLDGHVGVTSAGTARWHVGSAMDQRARGALDRAGYSLDGSPGAYASADFLDSQDLVIVMTREHLGEVRERLTSADTELVLWRHLIDPTKDLDVADPYYGGEGEFDECLATLASGGENLVTLLRSRLAARGQET